MASASTTRTVVSTETITLELSLEEAQALTDVLGLVGGSRVRSRRALIDNVYMALVSTDIKYIATFKVQDRTGSITFKEIS